MSNESKPFFDYISLLAEKGYSSSSARYDQKDKESSSVKSKKDNIGIDVFTSLLTEVSQNVGKLEEKIEKIEEKCEKIEDENKKLKKIIDERKTFYKTSVVFYKVVSFVFCGTVAGLFIVYLFFISKTLVPSLAEPTVINTIIKILGIVSPLGLSVWLWNVFFKNEIASFSKDIEDE